MIYLKLHKNKPLLISLIMISFFIATFHDQANVTAIKTNQSEVRITYVEYHPYAEYGEVLTVKEQDELSKKTDLQFNNDTTLLVKIIEITININLFIFHLIYKANDKDKGQLKTCGTRLLIVPVSESERS